VEEPRGDVTSGNPDAPPSRHGMMAAYVGFAAVIVVAFCGGMLSFGDTLARLTGLIILASLFLVPLAALTYLGTYRLTIGHRCRAARICEKYGYDVRASEGRCPECGKRIRQSVGGGHPR
jgi:hypothetical protein